MSALSAMILSSLSSFSDGQERACPCDDDVDVDVCFAAVAMSAAHASSPRFANSPQILIFRLGASPLLTADDGYSRFRSLSDVSADARLLPLPVLKSE